MTGRNTEATAGPDVTDTEARGAEQATGQAARGCDQLHGDSASVLLRRPGAGSLQTPQATRALQDRAQDRPQPAVASAQNRLSKGRDPSESRVDTAQLGSGPADQAHGRGSTSQRHGARELEAVTEPSQPEQPGKQTEQEKQRALRTVGRYQRTRPPGHWWPGVRRDTAEQRRAASDPGSRP